MKKTLLLLSLVIASVMNVNAQGYRGFFEVTPNVGGLGLGLDITTTHGWQFDDKIYVGLGTGVLNFLKDGDYTDNYLSDGETGLEYEDKWVDIAIPVFAKLRYDKLGVNRLTPFVEAKLGYCVVCDGGNPLFAGINVGARYAITERIGLNLGIGVSFTPYEYSFRTRYNARYEVASWNENYGWWYYDYDYDDSDKTAMNFAITLGVDF